MAFRPRFRCCLALLWVSFCVSLGFFLRTFGWGRREMAVGQQIISTDFKIISNHLDSCWICSKSFQIIQNHCKNIPNYLESVQNHFKPLQSFRLISKNIANNCKITSNQLESFQNPLTSCSGGRNVNNKDFCWSTKAFTAKLVLQRLVQCVSGGRDA